MIGPDDASAGTDVLIRVPLAFTLVGRGRPVEGDGVSGDEAGPFESDGGTDRPRGRRKAGHREAGRRFGCRSRARGHEYCDDGKSADQGDRTTHGNSLITSRTGVRPDGVARSYNRQRWTASACSYMSASPRHTVNTLNVRAKSSLKVWRRRVHIVAATGSPLSSELQQGQVLQLLVGEVTEFAISGSRVRVRHLHPEGP